MATAVLAAGLSGCGGAEAVAMGAEAQALAAVGLDPEVSASPTASPNDDRRERRKGRALLRKNTLHGEVVVQTKDGTKTVVVQRGAVTAIDDSTMTVKSTDGYTATWTFDEDLRVVERRTEVQPDQVKVGTEVGVAGTKTADTVAARLILIPSQ